MPESPPAATRLPRTVVVVGLASLFDDMASETVVPVIPILPATALAAGMAAIFAGLMFGLLWHYPGAPLAFFVAAGIAAIAAAGLRVRAWPERQPQPGAHP